MIPEEQTGSGERDLTARDSVSAAGQSETTPNPSATADQRRSPRRGPRRGGRYRGGRGRRPQGQDRTPQPPRENHSDAEQLARAAADVDEPMTEGEASLGPAGEHAEPSASSMQAEVREEIAAAEVVPPPSPARVPLPPPRYQPRERDHRDRPPQARQHGSPIHKAIQEVEEVITDLREALEQMEEVLETLELAEREKTGDEREIESLRRALRGLHRGRDNPPRQSHSQPQSRHSYAPH